MELVTGQTPNSVLVRNNLCLSAPHWPSWGAGQPEMKNVMKNVTSATSMHFQDWGKLLARNIGLVVNTKFVNFVLCLVNFVGKLELEWGKWVHFCEKLVSKRWQGSDVLNNMYCWLLLYSLLCVAANWVYCVIYALSVIFLNWKNLYNYLKMLHVCRTSSVQRTGIIEMQCSLVQYSAVKCSVVQYSVVQCSEVQWSAVKCSEV